MCELARNAVQWPTAAAIATQQEEDESNARCTRAQSKMVWAKKATETMTQPDEASDLSQNGYGNSLFDFQLCG